MTQQTLMDQLEEFGWAYPFHAFPEVTDEERQWLREQRPGLQDRIAASMARHIVKRLVEAYEAKEESD
jgi:hypothetical protein